MELGDDDALGTIDDEGTVFRHQRDLTKVDLLLFDITDRLIARLLVGIPNDQSDDHLDRRGESHSALTALIYVVLGLVEVIGNELQGRCLREVLDREDTLEHALQTDIFPLIGGCVLLQKLVIRLLLDVDEVGDVNDLGDLRVVLADPEVVLNHRSH